MAKIIFTAVLTFFVLIILYFKSIQYNQSGLKQQSKISGKGLIFTFLGVALLLRLILSAVTSGHGSDMSCFKAWSNMIFERGFGNFYSSPEFTDYPPGYMYVLYILGGIRKALNLSFDSGMCIMLYKLPAVLCDIVSGYYIYKIASKHFNQKGAALCSAAYIFNPAIIINSAIWGQVDSVFTLAVILMCYLVSEKQLVKSYFVFAIGILIKPQILIFTPVIIYGIIDQVFLPGFDKKKFFHNLFWGLGAIATILILSLPFGINYVIPQYVDTISSYPYSSINGYNLWTALGLNWQPQTTKVLFLTCQQWGALFIGALLALTTYISFKRKNDKSKYYLIAAVLIISMFVLSVRMHERYMFPGIILLLLFYITRPRKGTFILFSLFSALHLFNVAHVLYYYDPNNFSKKAPVPIIISILTCIVFVEFIIYIFKHYLKDNQIETVEAEPTVEIFKNNALGVELKEKIKASAPKVKISKIDIIAILVITAVYSAFALYDLGDMKAPETQWESSTFNDAMTFEFPDNTNISSVSYYLGNYQERVFTVSGADNKEGPYTDFGEVTMDSVFRWGSTDISSSYKYVRFTSRNDKAVIREMVFKDINGNNITPVNYQDEDIKNLFDEQSMFPERSTFRDSTYFDEIYHARTAYEYTQGLYSYENTHPPLGKIFISIGISLFGMNPFGWRIMGTLFGILMIPCIYIFAKKLLKKTWLATFVCLLFSFDFMHFSQTRIATIDVFVTFFIILMYYFMYQYVTKSFYDTSLKKTLIPLGLSGIMMGLGVASKWTGAYAGVGLAIIFFYTLYRRYKEYKYALLDKDGETNGIKHKFIIEHFKEYTIKTLLFCIVFFVIIPLIIYTLSYIPFVDSQGRGLFSRMIQNQISMFNYHSHVDATHPFSSMWYEWPVITRPIWYYSGSVSDTLAEGISSFGNPLVWWVGIFAFLYMVYLVIKKRDKKAMFLSVAYLAQYVPWIFVTRVIFIYHYFPSVPFVALMIGYAIYDIVKKKPKFKYAAFVYVAAAVGLFIMFYPVLSGQPVNRDYVSIFLRWFDSWVLVR